MGCATMRPKLEDSCRAERNFSQGPAKKARYSSDPPRELLFELIHHSHKHLNADQLYELAKKKRDPKINRVTVYRTLKLLKQEGLIDELDLLHHEGDQHYYETRLKREHAHIVCLRCGGVQEYFGEPLQLLKQQIESDFGFRILVARTEVGGYCPDCQATALSSSADAVENHANNRTRPKRAPRASQ